MLDINLIRNDPDMVRQAILNRGDKTENLDRVLASDVRRREILKESESLRATRNTVSKEIGRSKDEAEREAKKAEMRQVGDRIASLEEELRVVETELEAAASAIPNIPDPRTPVGPDEDHNIVLRTEEGECPEPENPKPHWELGESLNLIDFERGAKLSGSRFYVLNGAGARLQRALIAFMLDLHSRQGYREVYLPFMVKQQTLFAAGQLPKFRD
ncbi:MAG TPA: serine--tRNA ligase, partial [Thermoflexales bacterium]|nr:serine--tRNA ligase [Thermoflexales bacterium]